MILEIPLPVSPFKPCAACKVLTPSIYQYPSWIVITGVCPSSPGTPWIPWIPWAPSLPFVTVNVVNVPFVKMILYVSTSSSDFSNTIFEIPLPVSPCKPWATWLVLTPSTYQYPSTIVITGECPSLPGTPWIPWIPWAPSLPFVTLNVDVVPSV